MDKLELKYVDVFFKICDDERCVCVTPHEAFTLVSMPSLAGLIKYLVPQYELSEMPKE